MRKASLKFRFVGRDSKHRDFLEQAAFGGIHAERKRMMWDPTNKAQILKVRRARLLRGMLSFKPLSPATSNQNPNR